jgi:hypothetical protein
VALKICPMCKGRPVNQIHARIGSAPCDLCNGMGVLNTEAMCKCGRPAVVKLNGVEICTRWQCGKALLEQKHA